jgi:hypothetical protein
MNALDNLVSRTLFQSLLSKVKESGPASALGKAGVNAQGIGYATGTQGVLRFVADDAKAAPASPGPRRGPRPRPATTETPETEET